MEYECGEYVFQADRLPFPPHFFLFLLHPYKSKHQRNRYDCQRPRQLHDGRIFQYRPVRTVQRIPGGGRRRNGGGIVDRCSRKEPEARVSQPKYLSQRGENKRRYYIKKKNNGYGLGDLFIVRVNDRRCGRNGRTAADAGADADKSRRLAGNQVKAMPPLTEDLSLMAIASTIPAMIAITGAPITSRAPTCLTSSQEGNAREVIICNSFPINISFSFHLA